MARKARVDPESGWHHVMNRGAARQQIFHYARDGIRFEQLLAEGSEMHGVEVHAYCLMSNHFHLLVRCPTGGLSDFMHRVGSLYTRHINVRMARDGPIFRGRFRSLLIDTADYLDRAGRYIHRNPIDIRPVVDLDRYRWSSFRCYAGNDETPPWLTTCVLLDMHFGSVGYREFVDGRHHCETPGVGWAIDTVLAVACNVDVARRTGLRRTIAAAMVPGASEAMVNDLLRVLGDPSPEAQRQALYRGKKRAAEDPLVRDLVEGVRQAME